MNMQTTVGEPPELKKFSGIERAAALMLALGKDFGAPIWEQLSIDEESAEKASLPVSRLSPVRLLDKFTIIDTLRPEASGFFL